MEMKVCTKCGEEKNINSFYNESRVLDGKTSQCKECISKAQSIYYINTKNERKTAQKKYYNQKKWKFIYDGIQQRCHNQNKHNYNRYGGRGIECHITEEELKKLWFRDKAYEMNKPSIDRIDNDGNYTVENCQFIEFKENSGKNKRKPILQFDLSGNFIQEFCSTIEAERQTGFSHKCIGRVALGKRNQAYGYDWIYKND
jgi:hypothetical protein